MYAVLGMSDAAKWYKKIKKGVVMMSKALVIMVAMVSIMLSSCTQREEAIVINSPEAAIQRLVQGNEDYVAGNRNRSDISHARRVETADNGQHPFAIVVSCSDSRVPPEHVFSAGIGDLFVVRTAGNVVSDLDLGSIEFGAKHLGASVIVVLGHNLCGAVTAAMAGHIEGNITSITKEIQPGIVGAQNQAEAERLNIANTYNRILESEIVRNLVEQGKLAVVQSKYDIHTGVVEFF